jgi:hypothetical protein
LRGAGKFLHLVSLTHKATPYMMLSLKSTIAEILRY